MCTGLGFGWFGEVLQHVDVLLHVACCLAPGHTRILIRVCMPFVKKTGELFRIWIGISDSRRIEALERLGYNVAHVQHVWSPSGCGLLPTTPACNHLHCYGGAMGLESFSDVLDSLDC